MVSNLSINQRIFSGASGVLILMAARQASEAAISSRTDAGSPETNRMPSPMAVSERCVTRRKPASSIIRANFSGRIRVFVSSKG